MDISLLNQFSRSSMEKKKQIERNIAESIRLKKEASAKAEEALLNEEQEKLYSAASLSNAQYIRSRNKAKSIEESIQYIDKYTKKGVAHFISTITENALLLDPEEYATINPNYKSEIRGIVEDFLDNAELNSTVNENTNVIFEHVVRHLPDVKTGILLEDTAVMDDIENATSPQLDTALADLTVDVKDRVAELIADEQKIKNDMEDDIEKLVAMDKDIPEAEIVPDLVATDVEAVAKAEAPAINENAIVREIPRNGILETLATREAVKQIREGKEYNPDLAIANAITYVTVLESLNATGLVTIDKQDYRKMVSLAGGVLY